MDLYMDLSLFGYRRWEDGDQDGDPAKEGKKDHPRGKKTVR